jgi:hypothetical protein
VIVPKIVPKLPCEKTGRQTKSAPSVALSSTAARLLELQIQNGNRELKEFIELPHLESLLEVGKLGLTNPTEESPQLAETLE